MSSLKCTFDEKPCPKSNFQENYDPLSGAQCTTFNSQQTNKEIQDVKLSGYSHGLRLELNVLSLTNGVKVSIQIVLESI